MTIRPTSDRDADDDLIARVAQGDPQAFALLFRRRQGEVYRFALHMTGAPAAADDVTQDAFMVVMRTAARYEPGRSGVTAWLCGIARNCARQRLGRERPFQPLEDVDEDAIEETGRAADPLIDLTRAEGIAQVRRAVLSLPVRYREVVVLCDLQELSYAEAAEALACAVGTVRSRLHRGRLLLATKLSVRAADASTETSGPRDDAAPLQAQAPVGPVKLRGSRSWA
jgi:RNA polymerase sigma-70 factor (ECF subfamily)